MNEMKAFESYEQYKHEMDTELKNAAERFVKIGFLLRVARDTDILAGRYENVNDFAKQEYGLDKTIVSRWIQINEEFSKNGCSDVLEEKYQGFGWAKLTIMLQMPKEIRKELSPIYSKAELQTIKDEISEEKRISDLEILMEHNETDNKQTLIEQFLFAYGKEDPDFFIKLYEAVVMKKQGVNEMLELLAPTKQAVYMARIAGVGKMLLSIREETISLINVRNPEEEETLTGQQLMESFCVVAMNANTARAAWENTYGERCLVDIKRQIGETKEEKKRSEQSKVKVAKPKVAPVQQEEKQSVTEVYNPIKAECERMLKNENYKKHYDIVSNIYSSLLVSLRNRKFKNSQEYIRLIEREIDIMQDICSRSC